MALTSCFYRSKVSMAERLNSIYKTDFFNPEWNIVYQSELAESTCCFLHVFDVGNSLPEQSYLADDKDPTFEEYYCRYLGEIQKRETLDENYLPNLNEPYQWYWRYLWQGIFSYAEIRDPEHVKEHQLGNAMAVYSAENKMVYVIEVDFH